MSLSSVSQIKTTNQSKHADPARAEAEGVAAAGRAQAIIDLLANATKDGDDVRAETINNCMGLLTKEVKTLLWSVAGDAFAPEWIPETPAA